MRFSKATKTPPLSLNRRGYQNDANPNFKIEITKVEILNCVPVYYFGTYYYVKRTKPAAILAVMLVLFK